MFFLFIKMNMRMRTKAILDLPTSGTLVKIQILNEIKNVFFQACKDSNLNHIKIINTFSLTVK